MHAQLSWLTTCQLSLQIKLLQLQGQNQMPKIHRQALKAEVSH